MISVLGAGAFGGALAIAMGRENPVTLWGRGLNGRQIARLPGVELPGNVSVTSQIRPADDGPVLLALPMQALGGFLAEHGKLLDGRALVACCKGVDLHTLLGPTALIRHHCPNSVPAILTGPSFAVDIARGLPTALTLACADDDAGKRLQQQLSTADLRLYRTTDTIGAELGGALKNVVAIAAGMVMGAGLGESARAALMTRGNAEMVRLAMALGAKAETLSGLSGFGDLVLTCTSAQSRNFQFGHAQGRGQTFDASVTVEGVATAKAVSNLAKRHAIDMPITTMVAAVTSQKILLSDAIQALMSRPLKQE